jgi:hypothetical protein
MWCRWSSFPTSFWLSPLACPHDARDARSKRLLLAPQRVKLYQYPETLAGIFHECRRETFETEACRGCSQVEPTQAHSQSVEEAE